MSYTFHNNIGSITITKEVIVNTIKSITKALSLYEMVDIKFGKNVKGLITFYIYLKKSNPSIDHIEYINKFQKSLEKSIGAALNITNYFSIIILD